MPRAIPLPRNCAPRSRNGASGGSGSATGNRPRVIAPAASRFSQPVAVPSRTPLPCKQSRRVQTAATVGPVGPTPPGPFAPVPGDNIAISEPVNWEEFAPAIEVRQRESEEAWLALDASIEALRAEPGLDGYEKMEYQLEAARSFSVETSWEVVDDPSVIESCVGVQGDIGQAQIIADKHVRFVVDCLVRGNAKVTKAHYEEFEKLPPMMRAEKQSESVSVGVATLEFIEEDARLMAALLAPDEDDDGEEVTVSEEGVRAARVAEAICEAVDLVSECMPRAD